MISFSVAWVAGIATFTWLLLLDIQDKQNGAIASRRHFYGVVNVYEHSVGHRNHRYKLYHGRINHGLQFRHPDRRLRPVTYFSAHSGIGIAIRKHPKRLAERSLKVGVMGLGVGTLAAYCEAGDYFRFYEINPDVIDLANTYFSFLEAAKGRTEVLQGDARILLEEELRQSGSQQYDILVMDAFSGDAVPVHLLTKEALGLYFQHLHSDGILAIHISNRHIDLRPVVYSHAKGFDRQAIIIRKKSRSKDSIKGSTWVLVSNNQAFLSHDSVQRYVSDWPADMADIRWTDDYSSMVRVLKDF